MTIVHCRECHKEVERHDRICPHCGAEIPGEGKLLLLAKYCLFFVILGALMYALFNFIGGSGG
jgi:predicted amidophosphoribosyltransferase